MLKDALKNRTKITMPKIIKDQYEEEESKTTSKLTYIYYFGKGEAQITGEQKWMGVRKKSYPNLSKFYLFNSF